MADKPFEPGRELYYRLRRIKAQTTPQSTFSFIGLGVAGVSPAMVEENEQIIDYVKTRVLLCDGCGEPIAKHEIKVCHGMLALDYHSDRECTDRHHPRVVESFINGDKVEIGLPTAAFACDGCGVAITDEHMMVVGGNITCRYHDNDCFSQHHRAVVTVVLKGNLSIPKQVLTPGNSEVARTHRSASVNRRYRAGKEKLSSLKKLGQTGHRFETGVVAFKKDEAATLQRGTTIFYKVKLCDGCDQPLLETFDRLKRGHTIFNYHSDGCKDKHHRHTIFKMVEGETTEAYASGHRRLHCDGCGEPIVGNFLNLNVGSIDLNYHSDKCAMTYHPKIIKKAFKRDLSIPEAPKQIEF
jgi:hypothetical protein